jgi:hypothetical protein
MIEIKPSIAYLDWIRTEDDSANEMTEQGAFTNYLRGDLSFDVILANYLNENPNDLSRILIDDAYKKGLLCLFILKEEDYDDKIHQIKQSVNRIRKNYSSEIPILVIPYVDNHDEKIHPGYNLENVFISKTYSKPLKELLSKLKEKHKDNVLNEIRRLSQTEVEIMSQVYDANYPDDDCLTSLDNNSKSVIEFMRINLLPSIWRKSEFDDRLPIKIATLTLSTSNEKEKNFNEDFYRIKTMDGSQRQEFIDNVNLNAGYKRNKETGDFTVINISAGSDISGYAINTTTKETLLCSSFSKHNLAGPLLELREKYIESIRKNKGYNIQISGDCYIADPNIVTGLFHHSNKYLPDIKTPILQMFVSDLGSDSKLELGRYLLHEKNVIPIDSRGNLLCEEI